jgi:hypothetical protein
MVRTEKVVVAFIASPSDVDEERCKLEDVVTELNRTCSRHMRVRVDLVKWESHTFPDVGVSAQDVINRQIGDDYDIFIGVMWTRFGTPTRSAGSGTEEEFNRAWQRHSEGSPVAIMFYFKDAEVPPSEINLEQLTRIRNFQAKLGKEGVYYWRFRTTDDFVNLARTHLAMKVQQMQSEAGVAHKGREEQADATPLLLESEKDLNGDDLGFLDLMEICSSRMNASSDILGKVRLATADLNAKLNLRTTTINEAVRDAQGAITPGAAKQIVNSAADDMEQYVKRMDVETPMLRQSLTDGVRALGQLVSIAGCFGDSDVEQAGALRAVVVEMESTIDGLERSMPSLMSSIRGIPRMTTLLNKSKANVVRCLLSFQQAMADGRRDLVEVRKALGDIVDGTK